MLLRALATEGDRGHREFYLEEAAGNKLEHGHCSMEVEFTIA